MTKIKILALSMLAALSVNTAYAESTLTLGAGVGVIDQPYKGYDSEAYLIPAVSYDGDSFWFRGLGGGYYLWNDAADTLSVMAYWSPMYFKPDDSNDHQLRRLDKRKSTMMAGCSGPITRRMVFCERVWRRMFWITVMVLLVMWRGYIVM